MSILIVIGIAAVVLLGAIIAAGFKSADIEKEKRQMQGPKAAVSVENEKVLKAAHGLLAEERTLSARIRNQEVRAALAPVFDKAENIIKALQSDPDDIPSTKQFLNYYIPTLDAVLKKYLKLEQSNVDISLETEKIKSYIADIDKAMDRQYSNLFNDDKLDLSVEMEAMTMALQRDGLISESGYIKDEAEKKIELTL